MEPASSLKRNWHSSPERNQLLLQFRSPPGEIFMPRVRSGNMEGRRFQSAAGHGRIVRDVLVRCRCGDLAGVFHKVVGPQCPDDMAEVDGKADAGQNGHLEETLPLEYRSQTPMPPQNAGASAGSWSVCRRDGRGFNRRPLRPRDAAEFWTIQMRKKPPEVFFSTGTGRFWGQRAKKTTSGREGGCVREDRKRKDGVRRDAFSGQKQDGTPRAWVTKACCKHRGVQ